MSKVLSSSKEGLQIYKWAEQIFKFNRSLTGSGTVDTLNFIKNKLPNFKIKKIKSGTKVYDWTIPMEWNVKKAYVADLKGNKLINFNDNNLHLVGYSIPVNKVIQFKDLKKKLHTIKKMPNAIPYRYSYYSKDWGFCLQHNKLKKFKDKNYRVVIDSSLKKGNMHYGEILIKGKSSKEILLSTYICHPSMGNNEVSGPVLLTRLAKYLLSKNNLYYSYRIIFVPETIGAITYINKNYKILKKNVVAGYVVTCVGDNNDYSYLETKEKTSLSDKIAKTAFNLKKVKFKNYSFLQRGSDERQFNSPIVNLKIGSIMRTKHGYYKEYHTSLDNLDFISPKGFQGAYDIYTLVFEILEKNRVYKNLNVGEPFYTKYNLRTDTLGTGYNKNSFKISHVCAYLDGKTDLIDLSKILPLNFYEIVRIIEVLKYNKIIKMIS